MISKASKHHAMLVARRILSSLLAFVFASSIMLGNIEGAFASASAASSATRPAEAASEASSPTPSAVETATSATGSAATASADSSPTVVREIESSRTADSSTYLLSDGSFRAQIYEQPIHYKDQAGKWQDIDASLVPTDTFGVVHTKASAYDETIATDDVTDTPVTVRHGDWSMGMKLLGGEQSSVMALGNSADYPLAMTDTQLSYETRGDAIKDTLTLSSAHAPDTFTFFMSLDNLKVYADPTGGYALYDDHGKPAGRIEPLSVFDSAKKSSADEIGSVCTSATMQVVPADGGAYVTYRVPRSWLNDPARVFPVKVDPQTVYGASAIWGDTFVAANYPTTTYSSQTRLDIGWVGTQHTSRSLLRFNMAGITPGAFINSASLQLYCYQNTATAYVALLIEPVDSRYGAANAWDNSSTWSNTFGTSPALAATWGGTYLGISPAVGNKNFDVTPAVTRWFDGSLWNNGFLVHDATGDTSSSDTYRRFYSKDAGTNTPQLTVNYTLPHFNGASFNTGSYKPGDEVIASVNVASKVSPQNVQVYVKGSGGTVNRGRFIWTTTDPGFESLETSQVAPGSFFSFDPAWSPAGSIVADFANCYSTWDGSNRTIHFAYKIGNTYGDVQNNHLWDIAYDWATTQPLTDTGVSFAVLPAPTTALPSVVTTASAGWFAEADTNGDGVNDARDDTNAAGRGSAQLTWSGAASAAGYDIYLFDGNAYRKLASTTATSWASAGQKIYPSDSAIAALSSGYTGNPFVSNGYDLRDDPRPLYAKTAGTSWDTMPAYAFKIVPTNSAGSSAVSDCATIPVTLDDRTTHVNDDPRHATYELGSDLFHHTGVADLERGSLELDVTDLSIASRGPAAELSRHYSSALTTTTTYAPGWRFNFEKSLQTSSNVTTYTDETGDAHRFVNMAGTWTAPNGLVATLTYSAGVGTMTFKDRSVLTFNSSGQLTSEADADGNTVTYNRSPGQLQITAANGQSIVVSLTGGGAITQASYTTADGVRTVLYDEGAGYSGGTQTSVHYYPNDSDSNRIIYYYGSGGTANRLVKMGAPDFLWCNPWSPEDGQNYGDIQVSWNFGYDGAARLTEYNLANVWTNNGNQLLGVNTIGYGSNMATAYKPDSSQTLSWNPNSTLASKTAILDNTKSWTWAYGPSNAEVFSSTPLGHTIRSELDARDNVLAETDELGQTTTHTYDSLDRETSQTNPLGATDVKVYSGPDLSRETKSLTSAPSTPSVTEWDHDACGLVTEERQAIDSVTTATIDYQDFALNGEPQTTINRGVVLSPGGPATDLTSTKHYDNFGNLVWEKNAADQWVAKNDTYTTSGRLATSEVVTGTVTTYTYDALGGVFTQITAAGGVVANSLNTHRDPFGVVTDQFAVTDPAGDTAESQISVLDADGRVSSTCFSDATKMQTLGWTYNAYDAEGHTVDQWAQTTSSSQPAATLAFRTTYDTEGHIVSQTDPGANSNPTVTTYSPAGLATRIVNADESWETKAYDAAGNQVSDTKSKADGSGAITTNTHDLGGRLVATTDENGAQTLYSYDLAGHQLTAGIQDHPSSTSTYNTLGWVLSTTDADGIVTASTYDPAGRVTLANVGGKSTSSVYDAAGDLTSQTDPSGSTVHYEYDAFSRKTREWHEDPAHNDVKDIRTSYDYASHITDTSRSVGAGVTENDTYNQGLLAGTALGYGNTTSTVTYSIGNATEQSRAVAATDAPSFTRTVSAYDAAKRATDWSATGGLSLTAHRDFDGAGHESTRTGTAFSATATYAYGHDGRKSHDTLPFSLGGTIDSGYGYTADGRLASVTGSGFGDFGYDSAGNLTTYTATVDGSGTRTSGVLAYDSGGRLKTRYAADDTTPLETYSFDTADGWRTSQKRSAESTPVTYGYDSAGHLNAYSKPAGSQGTTVAISATYTYDALGQRSTSVVTSGSVTTTTTWTYDGLQLDSFSATSNAGPTWGVTYLYDQEGRPFAGLYRSSTASPTEFGIITTDRGDVAELTDANGNAFAAYRYDEWGRPLSLASQSTGVILADVAADIASRQVLRYAGYCFDSENGFYYLSARHYDPSTMQFLQKDPAKADGEESAYQYCGGDPVGKTDPSGMWEEYTGWKTMQAWSIGVRDASVDVGGAVGSLFDAMGSGSGRLVGALINTLGNMSFSGSFIKLRFGVEGFPRTSSLRMRISWHRIVPVLRSNSLIRLIASYATRDGRLHELSPHYERLTKQGTGSWNPFLGSKIPVRSIYLRAKLYGENRSGSASFSLNPRHLAAKGDRYLGSW